MQKYMVLALFIGLFSVSMFGQNDVMEACDQMPEIKGGFSELAKNVVYPKEAHKANIEGKVMVEAIVDESGDVSSVKVLKSVDKNLDKAALDAVKETKFIAGMHEGKKVKAKVVIPITFKLQDGKKN